MGLFEPAPGGVLLRAQLDDLDWFARQLARQPFDFTVIRPQVLRDAVCALARRLAAAGRRVPDEVAEA
jgi:predicted DNA-binding transcriptional regulator YafY